MIDAKNTLLSGLKTSLISIDWISVTSKRVGKEGYTAHPSLHDWENWETCSGVNGYTSGYKHQTGVRTYASENRGDMGKHTIYSGSSLRRVQEYNGSDPYEILDYHVKAYDSITRVDFAVDFINQGAKVIDFEKAFIDGKVNTRIKSASKTESITSDGYTFYLGSLKAKKKLVRVYNKASEQGLDGDWVRVETQIMGKPATNACRQLVKSENRGDMFIGICNDVANWESVNVWKELSESATDAEIGSISSEKGDTRKWIAEQCIPSIVKELSLDSDYAYEFFNELERQYVERNNRSIGWW